MRGDHSFTGQLQLIMLALTLCTAAQCNSAYEKDLSTGPSSDRTIPAETRSIDVFVNLQVETAESRRPIVKGSTNLPDGTSLLVTVESSVLGIRAQDRSTIESGRFSAGPFGPALGLEPGTYEAEVASPLARIQSVDVRRSIGEHGENLHGALVQQRDGESFIRAKTTFRIGDPKAAKKALDEMQTKSERVRKQIASLIAAGETMEHLRKASSLSSLEECGRQMRKNQAAAKKVSTEAATLDSVVLKVASTELVSCVSCTQTALTHCTAAKDALNGRLE